MTGPGIAELDVSADGSRVLIGRLVSTDAAGNRYWHLYMNVDGAEQSIDLMPGSTSGGIYAGMTDDGTAVYFSTPDQLGGDTDSSSDIYRADVSDSSATLGARVDRNRWDRRHGRLRSGGGPRTRPLELCGAGATLRRAGDRRRRRRREGQQHDLLPLARGSRHLQPRSGSRCRTHPTCTSHRAPRLRASS